MYWSAAGNETLLIRDGPVVTVPMWSRSKQEARACEIEMLGTIVQDMVFPEKGIRLCKDPGVRRNCGCSGLLSLGGRETGSRYADVGLHISCSPLGSWRKGGWVGSERKGGPLTCTLV